MPFTIVRQDITKMEVDAIVNAANTALQMGGGVCGAIFRAAGADELQAACKKVAPIQTGEVVMTPGFRLPCKFIIHAAGPVYHPQKALQCEALLRSAYTNALLLATQIGCQSIAFPLISSGTYGYPKAEALRVASTAIRDFLETADMDIYLAVFDRAAFDTSRDLLGSVKSYIDDTLVDDALFARRSRTLLDVEREALFESALPCNKAASHWAKAPNAVSPKGLEERIGKLDESFSTMLLRLIDAKGMKDTEVYKRANIDRKLFSKIRTGKGYLPSKRTALALSIALELTLEETDDLLERLGYTLSHSQKFDVIIEYFIINGKYDIFQINEVLFQYDLPLLGAM